MNCGLSMISGRRQNPRKKISFSASVDLLLYSLAGSVEHGMNPPLTVHFSIGPLTQLFTNATTDLFYYTALQLHKNGAFVHNYFEFL